MSSITIRKLDPALKERLRVRAAQHGHSMEAEARDILHGALEMSKTMIPGEPTGLDLYKRIHARFAPFGKIELELPVRGGDRDPPNFD